MNLEDSPVGAVLKADEVIKALQRLILLGRLPENLPAEIRANPDFLDLTNQLDALLNFTLSLANGDLDTEFKMRGRIAGALKSFQANLRHLTWQTKRIAAGDLNQSVYFMGEFASAFNSMVENLRQSQEALEARARELAEGRQVALALMQEAQAARNETQAAYEKLQEQMREITLLEEKLREQSIRDPLTYCYNRRYLEETLEREFARAQREDYPLSLVMIDIDHFKQVNDNFGHPAGDVVLKELSHLMFDRRRAGDIVCRYGGEEFLIVYPNMSLANALARAEEVRKAVQDLEVTFQNATIQITISLGVAGYPFQGHMVQDVIQAADQALYAAKQSGRNCVMSADPSKTLGAARGFSSP